MNSTKSKNPPIFISGFPILVRVTGLEPVRQRHTPLKRACLPIPAHSQICFTLCLSRNVLYHYPLCLSTINFENFKFSQNTPTTAFHHTVIGALLCVKPSALLLRLVLPNINRGIFIPFFKYPSAEQINSICSPQHKVNGAGNDSVYG